MEVVPEKTEKPYRVLREVWWEGLEWICVVHDRNRFYAVVTMVMNLQIPCSTENFWTRWGTNEKNSSLWLLWKRFFPPPHLLLYIVPFAIFVWQLFCENITIICVDLVLGEKH
jgi:hypothetical protein